jgi:transposase
MRREEAIEIEKKNVDLVARTLRIPKGKTKAARRTLMPNDRLIRCVVDLPPFLTQPVKTQNPLKGRMSHGIVEKDVHQGVQAGCGAAVGARGSLGEVARALEVNPNVLHRWRREIRQGPGNVFPGHGEQRWAEGRIAELERKIGQQALEIDFLKGCLQRIEEQRMLQALTGNPPSTKRSKKK